MCWPSVAGVALAWLDFEVPLGRSAFRERVALPHDFAGRAIQRVDAEAVVGRLSTGLTSPVRAGAERRVFVARRRATMTRSPHTIGLDVREARDLGLPADVCAARRIPFGDGALSVGDCRRHWRRETPATAAAASCCRDRRAHRICRRRARCVMDRRDPAPGMWRRRSLRARSGASDRPRTIDIRSMMPPRPANATLISGRVVCDEPPLFDGLQLQRRLSVGGERQRLSVEDHLDARAAAGALIRCLRTISAARRTSARRGRTFAGVCGGGAIHHRDNRGVADLAGERPRARQRRGIGLPASPSATVTAFASFRRIAVFSTLTAPCDPCSSR